MKPEEGFKDYAPNWCEDCRKQYHREYRSRPENLDLLNGRVRTQQLARFGLTPEDYDRMVEAQAGLCAVCERPPDHGMTSKRQKPVLSVDHDHETGRVRDLLCHRCNLGLGHFLDDPELLRTAAAYLERHAVASQPARPRAFDPAPERCPGAAAG